MSLVTLEPVDSVLSLRRTAEMFEDIDGVDETGADLGMIRDGGTELKEVVVTIDVVLAEDPARVLPVL